MSDANILLDSNSYCLDGERTKNIKCNNYKKKLKQIINKTVGLITNPISNNNQQINGIETISHIRNIEADAVIYFEEDLDSTEIVAYSPSTLSSDSEDRLISDSEIIVTRTYRRRFWILAIFSFYSFFTCLQWDAWGPISASMIATFPDWNYGTVAWMESWVTVMFVICMLPVCWTITRFSLRTGMLISSTVLTIGLGLRCITDKSPIFTIMCHLSSIMLGFSTTVVFSAPPMVASVWFPPNERTTAVAFIMASSQLGTVGSYLEPLLVHQPSENIPKDLIKKDVMFLNYLMASIAGGLLILFFAYFSSKPPLHPSIASSTDRLDFKNAFLTLIRDKNLMILIFIYGVASGPTLGWIGMLNYSLEPLGFNQNEAMIVGVVGVLACVFSSVVAGSVTDHIFGYLRETIIVLLLIAACSFYWLLLISHNVIPVIKWQVYVSVSLGLSCHYATISLFYELAAEIAYPAPEVLVGGFVTSADCLSSSIFLFIYLFKDIGFRWVTYTLVGSIGLSVLALLFIKDGYRRSKLDNRGRDTDDA